MQTFILNAFFRETALIFLLFKEYALKLRERGSSNSQSHDRDDREESILFSCLHLLVTDRKLYNFFLYSFVYMSKDSAAEGNIQTFLRIRPSKKPSGYFSIVDEDEEGRSVKGSLQVTLPDNFKSDYVNNSLLKHSFQFNGVIDMSASQEEVFDRVGVAAVQNALDGFNSTIFAYGQTGKPRFLLSFR